MALVISLLLCGLLFHAVAEITDFGYDQPRYWPKYGGKRKVRLLDGVWETGQLGSTEHPPPKSFDSMDPTLTPSDPIAVTPNKTTIPSCIDNTPPGYLGYRGITFFRTHFDYDLARTPARLVFQACSFYCRVWVNGKEIGDHRAGGYVAFVLEVPRQEHALLRRGKNQNELVVLVDNRFNSTTAPMHERGDYWHYSGIMRSVELHSMPDPEEKAVWPWRAYILPETLSSVRVTVHVTDSSFLGIVSGDYSFDNGPAKTFSRVCNNGIVVLGDLEVPNPRVWSIGDPQLHILQVNINEATVTERFGLRLFGVDEESNRITVNGKIIKLVGWNHHTQWPESAASPTDREMDNDITLLREGGANFVRGSHYPQDPRWLDRLDEAGMVMWSETLGAGVQVEDTQNHVFMKYQIQQLNEMMDNAMNHASIALWAFFNEGPSDSKDACVGYQECVNTIKARDQTRFVTWASNQLGYDKCLGAADVVSFNSYPGWYGRYVDPKKFWNQQANSIRKGVYPGSSGKAMIISETGAGGIYEWSRNETANRWTLAYQSEIIAKDVDVAIGNDNISGITLWHFMDFKTFDDTENNTHCDYIPERYPPLCAYINASKGVKRPGGLNHKGSLDFWRRKKPIFDIVASKYNKTKRTGELSDLREE